MKVARSSISDSEPIGGRPEQIQALAELSGADALINGTITILPRSLRVGKFVIGFWSARTGKSFAKATLESDDGIDPYDAGRLACRALVREHDE
ncbi:MAG TPA: hypothetical protein VJ891_05195 [Casimicrobiaceae bacterium]|nr:hypothetical protein [Casimicrobiaceae bacterium]